MIFILLFTAGCVTVPVREGVFLKGPIYQIDNIPYVPLSSVIDAYKLNYDWDPIARKLTLRSENRKVILCIGSNAALIDSVPKNLDASVKMQSGIIVLPRDFASYDLAMLFIRKEMPIPQAPGLLPHGKTLGKIVLDAGHGGRDPGAIGYGLEEKEIVLDIVKRLKYRLEGSGINVILTRDDDRFISLWKRADVGNKEMADLFISVHANASPSKYIKGFEVYCLSEAVDDSARAIAASENASLKYERSSFGAKRPSSDLEATLWDIENTENREESIELARRIAKVAGRELDVENRGVKSARFYVLKGAMVPSILIEVGFISNRQEARILGRSEYRENLAKAIADGIIDYKKEYEKTEGFTR